MKNNFKGVTAADIAARREANRDRETGHFGHGKLVEVADRSSFDDDFEDVHLEAARALAVLNLYDRGEVPLHEARNFLIEHHGLTEDEATAFLTQKDLEPTPITNTSHPTVNEDGGVDDLTMSTLNDVTPQPAGTGKVRCPQCQRYWDSNHECPEMSAEQKAEEVTESFIEAIESIQDSDDFKRALDFASSIHAYSFSNQLLLWSQHRNRTQIDSSVPADPGVFMGFNSWKNNERTVMKGQRGYSILAPNTFSIREYRDPSGAWIRLNKGEKAPAGSEVRSRQGVKGFRVTKVFAEWQTDGEPIPQAPKPKLLEGGGVQGLTPTVEGLLTDMGYKVSYVEPSDPRLMGANGVTDPRNKEIWVRNDVSAGQQQKTLVHEYAHAKLHGAEDYDYRGHRGFAETQAESVAYMVFKRLDSGFDSSEYSIPYVASWSASMGGGDKVKRSAEMRRALNGISDVTTSILDAFKVAGKE